MLYTANTGLSQLFTGADSAGQFKKTARLVVLFRDMCKHISDPLHSNDLLSAGSMPYKGKRIKLTHQFILTF